MRLKIDDYKPIVGQAKIDELKILAEKLSGKTIQNINSTAVGGGVAEILNRMVPLLNQLGVNMRWDVMKGGDEFFQVTKKFHNALHDKAQDISDREYELFRETNRQNLEQMDLYGDIIFIHDPQPSAFIEKKRQIGRKWIWRCHIDVSKPDPKVWNFLKGYVEKYDASVFSAPQFSQELAIRQFQIPPSIDPLSDKNKDLPQSFIDSVLEKYNLPKDEPLVTQISRFDYLKDPVGVIEAFKLVKEYINCHLVLAGGTAVDDPEGMQVLAESREAAGNDPNIHILDIPSGSDLEINALQRASAVVVQKSLKEGFGLTVSEALWKAKPVVASAVGGIPLQIKHKWSGLLCHSVEGAAFLIKQLLHSPEYAKRLGENGREHVRNNFLLTRHIREYMLLFLAQYHDGDIIYL